ncbi:uncharacterized protein [Ptychodera flava]|uniref:uncharacterized protein n=1 Tax=Ptychodera flava TaxID=63121 RepID=UPI003969FC7E
MEIGKDYALANDIGSCVNNECYNGATCTVISPCSDRSETEPYQYVCQCPDGYRGLLCEETTKYINVAIGKPVSQISTAYGGLPEFAVDGDNNPYFALNGVVKCTHTLRVLNAWWKVDLEKGYLIKWINITNRGDMDNSEYSWRILSSEVRVGFSETFANNGVCGQITEIFPEETDQILLDCDHMFGRFVSVERTDATDEPLTLCEVEVYAQDPEEWRVVFVGLSRSTDDLYQLWLDGTAVGDESNAFSNSTSNYVNDVIGIWDALDVKYVKLSLFKDDVEVATIVFDGVGSTKTNWFSPSRLLGSSWTDLTNETDSMMSGTDAGQGDLGFSVSVATGLIICNSWNGWILVMQTSCGWAPTNSEWVVMYSTSVNQDNWNSGGTDEADLMMIQILS